MKKLMFATALAASVAAFGAGDGNAMAAPLNSIGFGGYGSSVYNGTIGENGQAEKDEAGIDKTAGSLPLRYFFFDGESNSSVVTNEPAESVHTKHTDAFDEATDANYLALDTEGGTLWRSINTISESGSEYGLGDARAVAGTGTYLDTLVQFTVTEDEAPTVGEGDKLAIWLQAVEGETNLMVRAAIVEGVTRTPTNFTLNATVEPGVWYRLTVKALADITDEDHIPGFQIFLDGNVLTSDTITLAGSTLSDLAPEEFDDSHYADIVAGKYFASLLPATTLQGVGFQGTGAVDEIVWTEKDLFPAGGATTISFTLTGGENATVSYVIGSGVPQNWDGASTISVDSGAEVTFTATPASGYTYTGVTAEGWVLNNTDLVCTTNSAENITLAVPGAIAIAYTLTVPTVANATLTAPASLTGIAPGTEVALTWTAAEGYTFSNGSKTMTKTITVNGNQEVDVSDVESSLSKETFTVTITDIENATIAATTNSIALTDALSENTTTNEYTVEYGDTVTVTATAAEGYEYATAPEGWTLTEGVLSIETNVTAAVELAAPVPTAIAYTLTVTGDANATYVVTINGNAAATGDDIVIGDEIVVTATANTGYNYTETPEGWTAGEGVITKTITVATADVEVKIPAPAAGAPSSIEIEPGTQGTATYTTEEDAAAVTNNVTVAVPAAVSAAGVDATAYKANFEPKVVSDGNGGYKIEIGLTAAAEADLQTQANTDAGTLVSDITASEVTITTTPGFYYSVKYGSSLNAMNAQTASVLADGATESITLPAKSGTSGFYKVVISIVPNEAVTP